MAVMETPGTISPTTASPDWSTINRDILCPLCDYNLKMLTEPRCPECGHRFEWADVLAEDRDLRGFFEHARGRWLMSIFWTWLASLFSLWFWKRVKTTHPVRRGRLIVFAALISICEFALAATVLGYYVGETYSGAMANHRSRIRQHERAILRAEQPNPNALQRTSPSWFGQPASQKVYPPQFPTTQAYLDAVYPAPTIREAIDLHLSRAQYRQGRTFWMQANPYAINLVAVAFVLLAWPPMTLVLFGVFRVSLRRAGISVPHLIRVVVYCSTIIVFVGPLWMLVEAFISRPRFIGRGWDSVLRLDQPTAWVLLILLAWLAIRLAIAMHRYLRIPQGVIMALLSQIIVMLIALQFLILITPAR